LFSGFFKRSKEQHLFCNNVVVSLKKQNRAVVISLDAEKTFGIEKIW